MANGALPETNALAEQAMQLGTATFHDCDVLHDVWGLTRTTTSAASTRYAHRRPR